MIENGRPVHVEPDLAEHLTRRKLSSEHTLAQDADECGVDVPEDDEDVPRVQETEDSDDDAL